MTTRIKFFVSTNRNGSKVEEESTLEDYGMSEIEWAGMDEKAREKWLSQQYLEWLPNNIDGSCYVMDEDE